MSARPTQEDLEALDLLLDNDRLDEDSATFIEDLKVRADRGGYIWSIKQCAWFDRLCERYL